tara:strand:+ start:2234 stop:2410 length:177 start_codon:yes stop_codon:yes gene_type:complete
MAYPTNPIYKLLKNEKNDIIGVKTVKNSLTYSIPVNPENSDYQQYLEWAKTNTAEAAD